MQKDDMNEDELISCLIRMNMPVTCENCDQLTDEEVGQQVRKAHELFLDSRELMV